MSDPLPIELHYNKVFGAVMLALSLFILGVAFTIGKPFPQAVTGGITLLASIGFLTQPVLVVAAGEVQMRNLLGMTMKRHEFGSLADLELRDGRLRVKDQPVGSGRWLMHRADWERLGRAIETARASKNA
jgi:hypothetical protein